MPGNSALGLRQAPSLSTALSSVAKLWFKELSAIYKVYLLNHVIYVVKEAGRHVNMVVEVERYRQAKKLSYLILRAASSRLLDGPKGGGTTFQLSTHLYLSPLHFRDK